MPWCPAGSIGTRKHKQWRGWPSNIEDLLFDCECRASSSTFVSIYIHGSFFCSIGLRQLQFLETQCLDVSKIHMYIFHSLSNYVLRHVRYLGDGAVEKS
jgi:hypothetical protein